MAMTPNRSPWPMRAIGELAADERNAITDGPFGSKLKTEHYTEAGPRVIRLANIGDGFFVDAKAHISESHFASLQKHRVFPGDLVIAAMGENPPRSCLVPDVVGEAIVKADCIRFKPGPELLAKFANYAINSEFTRRALRGIVHGVGRPRLNLTEIKAIKIPVPRLDEQQRIVAEIEKQFTRLEAAVASLKRVEANIQRYRNAVLAAACDGRLTSDNGDLRHAARPTNNTNHWSVTTLDQACSVFVDSAHRTPKYSNEGPFALGPRDVVNGVLNLQGARRVTDHEFAIQTRRRIPQAGDIVYSRELSLGWAAAIPEGVRICLSQGMCLFRPQSYVLADYLLLVLNSSVGRKQATSAATGSAHPHINLSDIKSFQIPLPPLAEQHRIVAEVERRLSVVDELEQVVEANLKRAKNLRQSILHRAFSGEL